jgi:hypothetical protein
MGLSPERQDVCACGAPLLQLCVQGASLDVLGEDVRVAALLFRARAITFR